MFRPRCRNGFFTAVLVGVTLMCCSAARGQVQAFKVERHTNETGETARCLMKFLDNWRVRAAACPELPACEVLVVGRYTVIRCHGVLGLGSVPDGESAHITLQGTKLPGARILTVEWYKDEDCSEEEYAGEGGAVASVGVDVTTEPPGVTVEHAAYYWNHVNNLPGAARQDTVYGRLVKYAIVPTWLSEVGEGLFSNPSITWHSLEDFTLNTGESTLYPLDGATVGDVVLFGFYTVDSPLPGASDFELVQFRAVGIPAMSAWGGLVMTMLLLTAATLAVLRRRRARTT